MRISVFGLGYVGIVSAACLSSKGHSIIGVDINNDKVNLLNSGKAPIIEKQLDQLLSEGAASGNISATTSTFEAVKETELSLICVGTPSHANGKLDIHAVENVCREIARAIKKKNSFHVIVIRSTVLPGTLSGLLPMLEQEAGGKSGEAFGLVHNPEFLREGSAVEDFFNPAKTVIGAFDKPSGDTAAKLYEGIDAPLIITSVDVSEMVKYADNVWHALKVCFGNEIGNICKEQQIDSHAVMDIFLQDTKLNISPNYLKPGFAFGGSCLPKDTRALVYRSRELDLELPIIFNIMESNRQQVERAVNLIIAKGKKRISVLGFSFKADTDDLRESPKVELIERLIGKGYDLKLYDRNVHLAALFGANKDYILNTIPHISSLLVDEIQDALEHAEIVIVGNRATEFSNIASKLKDDQILVDLAHLELEDTQSLGERYDGINW